MMGRKAREFTPMQVKEMVRLFNAGESIDRIGKLHSCSGQLIGRILRSRLGDLRIARAMAKAGRSIAAGAVMHLQYREGYEAGYRMALTHVNLHGLEQAREHCSTRLGPWRDGGYDDIPPVYGSEQ